jgi:hypothetical protein
MVNKNLTAFGTLRHPKGSGCNIPDSTALKRLYPQRKG